MVEKLTPKQLARVAAFDASCNELAGERVVATPNGEPWPHEEIDFYLRNLFPCQKPPIGEGDDSYILYADLYNRCVSERTRQLHRMLVADRICWKSEGADANRDLADRIDVLCRSEELSGSARGRCEKYAESVRANSTPTLWKDFLMWLGGAAFLVFLFGGPTHDLYNIAKDKVKSWRSKDPPNGPGASGGGKFGDGVVIDAKYEAVQNESEADGANRSAEAVSAAGLFAFLGYAAVGATTAARAALPFVIGAARAAAGAASAFMVFPAAVMEGAVDPDRRMPPDA